MALLSLLNGTLPCGPSLVIRHCPSKWCRPSLLIRCPHARLSPLPSCHSAGRSVTRGGHARAGRGRAPGGRGESPGAGPWPSRPLLAILAILAFTMARRSLAITCPSPVAPLPDKERQPASANTGNKYTKKKNQSSPTHALQAAPRRVWRGTRARQQWGTFAAYDRPQATRRGKPIMLASLLSV